MKKYALLIILFTVFFVISCSSGDTQTEIPNLPVGENEADVQNTEEEEAVSDKITADVPDMDLNGYEFTILAQSTDFNIHWFSRDISAEEQLGEPINDAVYIRNRAVEDRFNITINGAYTSTPQADARNSINAGDKAYDVLTFNIMQTAVLAQEGMLLDLMNHVPYVDLEKPWWDQRANRHLSIGNKLYYTVGDLLIIDNDSMLVFFVNNDIIKEYGMDNPYQMVRDGTWTVDKMWEMATEFSHDVNGDGTMDGDDAWGLLTQFGTFYGNIMATGQFIASKDHNDMPVLDGLNPRIVAAFDKWIDIMMDRGNTMYAQDFPRQHQADLNIWDNQVMMFSQGRGLFMYTHLNRATLMRPLDFQFGILPNPKLDASQTEYYNYVFKNTTKGISIPITADAERSGLILEALSAESRYTLRPAYFEISLTEQMLRDEDSSEMMDLIFETRMFDTAHLFNWGGILGVFNNLAERRQSNLISAYEAAEGTIETDMNKTIEFFSSID